MGIVSENGSKREQTTSWTQLELEVEEEDEDASSGDDTTACGS